MSIEVKNLHIEYPDQLVFSDVNLSVADNELVAVETDVLDGGTSLLKAISGFLKGVEGEVWFEGHNLLTHVPDLIHHQIGYVYEDQGLVSIYSIYQNISLPLQFHTDMSKHEILKKVLEVSNLLQIPETQFGLRPHELNDVQIRLVNLARALIVDPKLLLIDELEGGMSDEILLETIQVVKDRQMQHPMAIIMTTSSDIVMQQASRVYKIENHNLVAVK